MTKIFASRESNDPLPHEIGRMFGLRFSQGGYYISAQSKAQAVELGTQANLYISTRSILLAREDNSYLNALRGQGGLLAFPGVIVASPCNDKRYALWSQSAFQLAVGRVFQKVPSHTWVHIGTSEYDYKTYEVTYTPEAV
jgi:hypothetical protein